MSSRTPDSRAFDVTEAFRGSRLDRFLQAMVPRMSRASVQVALSEGRVELSSGVQAKAARRLVPGERVVLYHRPAIAAVPECPPVLAEGEG